MMRTNCIPTRLVLAVLALSAACSLRTAPAAAAPPRAPAPAAAAGTPAPAAPPAPRTPGPAPAGTPAPGHFDDEKAALAAARAELDAARQALNREDFARAAALLEARREQILQTREAGNALYWEAFARYRLDRTSELRRAAELLRRQQADFDGAETARDGEALLARVYAELAQRGEVDAAREVRELSGNDDQREETRIQALHALLEMDPDRALPVLADILRGKRPASPSYRRNAVFLLCRTDDPRAEDLLIELAGGNTDADLLSEVVICLSMKDSDRSLDAIVAVFNRAEDPRVSESAAHAIGRHGGDRAFAVLTSLVRDRGADIERRRQALFSLSNSGRDKEVSALAQQVLRDESDSELLQVALLTLSRLDDAVPENVFLSIIENPRADDELRAQALHFAAQNGKLSVPQLRGVYDRAAGSELKMQVCHVLTQVEDRNQALDLLLVIARKETDPEIRQAAVYWVSEFEDDPRAAAFLLEVIEQE
ncbi:MAG: HEAT repeat domain-containing protein [bacterium]|nr:HEAT repeat domain-containing protein [bacterium]